MADITFVIPDNVLSRVIDGVAYANGYEDTIDSGNQLQPELVPNPESKVDFARRMIREYIKHCVQTHEVKKAAEEAQEIAFAAVENEVTIT